MSEPRYCDLCGCICVACAQLDGCDDCDFLSPELLDDYESLYIGALLDHFDL